MIRLALDEMTMRGIRIAVSPLWESLSSLALLARYRGEVPFPYTSWARHARAALPEVVRTELLDLTRTLHPAWLPSFPVPVPTSPDPEITDELAALAAQGPADDARLVRFVALTEEYWNAALAPYWASMRNALEEEILFRGHKLATEGANEMLADLGGRVRWERPVLYAPYQIDLDHKLDNAQLFLVPVLFARGMRILSAPRDNVAAMSYQARGAAVLAEHASTAALAAPEGCDRLAILVGRGRAAVMRALIAPTTTTAVAGALGLAPSTVSQHLSALSDAGVVRRQRVGYRVLYELDHVGVALLKHVDGRNVG